MAKPLIDAVIARARRLIDDDDHWIQGSLAVSIDGTAVEPHDPRAVRFCASGAMLRAAFELTNDFAKVSELRDAACRRLLPRDPYAVNTLEDLNDTTIGRCTILHLFDEYLEQAWAGDQAYREAGNFWPLRRRRRVAFAGVLAFTLAAQAVGCVVWLMLRTLE